MCVVPVVHNVLQINTCRRNVVKYICKGCVEPSVFNRIFIRLYY